MHQLGVTCAHKRCPEKVGLVRANPPQISNLADPGPTVPGDGQMAHLGDPEKRVPKLAETLPIWLRERMFHEGPLLGHLSPSRNKPCDEPRVHVFFGTIVGMCSFVRSMRGESGLTRTTSSFEFAVCVTIQSHW